MKEDEGQLAGADPKARSSKPRRSMEEDPGAAPAGERDEVLAAQHRNAAFFYESAAHHHRRAARAYEAREHEEGDRHAEVARGHGARGRECEDVHRSPRGVTVTDTERQRAIEGEDGPVVDERALR